MMMMTDIKINSLKNYFQKLSSESAVDSDVVMEDGTMRPLKKYAQVDIKGAEGLYETNVDRWSRKAKHHLAKAEIVNAADQPIYEIGEVALYQGQEVKVKIPQGPQGTTGVMFEGHLKMVHQSKLSKLEENVVSALQSVVPINRIMQLAGLDHVGAITTEIVKEEIITEADASTMISQLITAAQGMPQYKSNTEAARMFVYGNILSEIYKELQSDKFQTVQGQNAMPQLSKLGVIGAQLIKTAQIVGQNTTPGATAATTNNAATGINAANNTTSAGSA